LELKLDLLEFLLVELFGGIVGFIITLGTLSGQSFVDCLLNESLHFIALVVHHALELVFHFFKHLRRFLHTQG
jgi:hypothetical protein